MRNPAIIVHFGWKTVRSAAHNAFLNTNNWERRSHAFPLKMTPVIGRSRLVHSRLDYGNSVLVGVPVYLMRRLQSVLNAAVRLIFHLRRSDHISDALVCLHWLRVPKRIEFKIAVLTYKVLCGAAPRYLGPLNRTADMADRRPLRSSATNRLVVPSYRLSSVGSRAFRLPPPRSGTHCQTTSSLQHPYRLFDAI